MNRSHRAAAPDDIASQAWEVPAHTTQVLQRKQHAYCVVIPVINEGRRIRDQLTRMQAARIHKIADIVIADGGSTDGSLDAEFLASRHVSACLIKQGPGKLGAQLRVAYAFAVHRGYKGVVTIDGNGKDNVEAIADFIEALEQGVDFVQGSRFIDGGRGVRTPWPRHVGIRLVHAPLLSWKSGHRWTDTTNGFRGYSRRLLTDARLGLFRDIFAGYELLFFCSARAPGLGHTCREIPVSRIYPERGATPTKISPLRGNFSVLANLLRVVSGYFDPPS